MGYLSNPVYRRMQRASVALPDMFGGHELHVYAFAQDNTGRCSETAYAHSGSSSDTQETIDIETGEVLSPTLSAPLDTPQSNEAVTRSSPETAELSRSD